jgi:tRNA(Arg) A34 adenosine deaminase TadA
MISEGLALPDWLRDWPMPAAGDETACMRIAISLATENVERGAGGPFGAVLRDDAGRIVSAGVNLVPSTGNPVLHAEIVAYLRAASMEEKLDRLTLVTSCEPCIMCLGASHWAGVGRIVSGALKADAEACGFDEGVGVVELRADMQARGVTFTSGLLRDEAAALFNRYRDLGRALYGP